VAVAHCLDRLLLALEVSGSRPLVYRIFQKTLFVYPAVKKYPTLIRADRTSEEEKWHHTPVTPLSIQIGSQTATSQSGHWLWQQDKIETIDVWMARCHHFVRLDNSLNLN